MINEDKTENTQNNVRLEADQISAPKAGLIKRHVYKHFKNHAENFISDSIREFAMTDDGKIDNELADFLRRKLTQRAEVSMHRDVIEPIGWAAFSGVAMGAGAMVISKQVEGRAFTPATAMAMVTSTALGSCLDLYRVKRRFDSGLNGALAGALQSVKEERSPRWDKRVVDERERDFDGEMLHR